MLAPLWPWQAPPCHLLDFSWLSLKQLQKGDESPSSQGADCRVGGCVCRSGMHCLISRLHPWRNSLSLCLGTCSKHNVHLGFRAGGFWLAAVAVGCLPCSFQFAKPSWAAQGVVSVALQAPCPRIMLLSVVPVMSAIPASPHLLFKRFLENSWNPCCH